MGPCVLKGMEETAHLCPRKVLGEGREDVNVVGKGGRREKSPSMSNNEREKSAQGKWKEESNLAMVGVSMP